MYRTPNLNHPPSHKRKADHRSPEDGQIQKKRRSEDRPSSNGGLPQELPPLPSISRQYEKAVFTHASTAAQTEHSVNYERLEFLGDAQLEHIASVIIFERFQTSTPGKMSSIREALVNNESLAKFTRAYGLDQRLKISVGDYQPREWNKIHGDLFEAYVAAVILSEVDPHVGFDTATRWLSQLWEPTLKQLGLKIMAPRDILSKEQLAKAVLVKGAKVSYVDEKDPVMFKAQGKQTYFIGAYLTGLGYDNQHLGSGQGESKAEAGQNAAKNALLNPMLEDIKAKRAKFLEEKERQDRVQEEKEKVEEAKKKEERDKKNAEMEKKKQEKARREQAKPELDDLAGSHKSPK
ncbi:hypothetical protein LTR64_007960 [Lithohypha guttulata]|uniref:uncharacterized protein n=1 Tax=Lithohypha guttulata TaxID=1690604 RepID=UPI002DE08538|nr:hypothetical protein LTR51_008171 [Lithohypha guttulata]